MHDASGAKNVMENDKLQVIFYLASPLHVSPSQLLLSKFSHAILYDTGKLIL